MDEVRRLIRLAWPVVLAQIGLVGMGVADLVMIGPLGGQATAALGLGNTWSLSLFVVALGAAAGIDPVVTQAYGAQRPREAGLAAARGLVIAGVLVGPVVALHLLAGPILAAMGQPTSVVPMAATYCAIVAVSMPPLFAFSVVRQLLQGGGSMQPAMWVILLGNVVNVVGNALLIGPYGIAGVAWSTVVVRWVMLGALVGMGAGVIRRAWPQERVVVAGPLGSLAALSLPVALQVGLEVWAFNAASFVAGWLGDIAIAAHVASLSAVALPFHMAGGVSAAAATRVGNLVGAGRDWQASARISLGLGMSVMLASGFVFATMPTLVGRAYSTDPAVVGAMGAVLPIGAAFGVFDGGQVVAFGILRGLGDTRVPSIFNLVGYWLLGLPLGTALALGAGLGLAGLWAGLAISLVVVLALLLARIRWHAQGASH